MTVKCPMAWMSSMIKEKVRILGCLRVLKASRMVVI